MDRRSLDEIFGQRPTLDEIFAEKSVRLKPLTKEQRENNKKIAEQIRPKRTFADKLSEFMVTNPASRKFGLFTQGVANSSLNPWGYGMRALGIDTKPLEAQNAQERISEKLGEYGADAAMLKGVGGVLGTVGLLGKGISVPSKIAQAVLNPTWGNALVPAAGAATLTGAINPRNTFAQIVTDLAGAGIAGGVKGALTRNIKNVGGGLKNNLSNNKANVAISKGIKASEEVAQRVSDTAPEVYNSLNADMAQSLDELTGRKINIERAISNQKQRYDDFIRQNYDMELLDFSPTREQLREYKAQSIFNSPKSKLSPEESGEILKNRAKKNNIEIDGQIEHFTNKGDRGQYTRTLSNTLNNPDIEFSFGNKGYVVKKYDTNGKPFFDFVTKKDGKLYNKFNTNAKYVDNQIKKTAENVSLNGRIQQPTDAGYIRPADEYNNIISNQRVVVNRNMPRLSDYTNDLDQFQQESLAKAINKGATMSTSAKGSLGATHRAQEVLNDMIDNSYDTSVIGTKKATTETRELMEVKDRLNQILEPSGIKPYDKSLSKAKNLQVSFEKGYNFKPSNFKFDNMGLKTARDKQAFLQGRIQKLTDNVLSDGNTNLATAIKKDENTLRKLMPENKFQELMKKAGKIETEFERLKTLESAANQRLRKQPVEGRSINRENFESRGALIGRAFDVLEGIIKGKSNARSANMYLNPNTTQITDFGGLRGAGQETYPYLFREVVNYLTNKNNSRNN